MRIGSLFSGIGGLELGLEWSGLGHTVFQVEQNGYCRQVLAKHWPDVPRFADVQAVSGATLPDCDVLCGGFPCQDVSTAGRGDGLDGARSGLWWEFARLVGEIQPRGVVVENVASGASRWVDDVLCALERLGYATLLVPCQANWFGLPHLRSRLFIVAYAHGEPLRQPGQRKGATAAQAQAKSLVPRQNPGRQTKPPLCRVDDGIPNRLDNPRFRALGNAVVPQCAELVGCVLRYIMEGGE